MDSLALSVRTRIGLKSDHVAALVPIKSGHESIFRCPRYSTRAVAVVDLFDYIEPFYNRRRRHSALGYASPMKFLEDWISTQHAQQLAA